jgi:hypothetical protein
MVDACEPYIPYCSKSAEKSVEAQIIDVNRSSRAGLLATKGFLSEGPGLARISHQISTAASDLGMSTALRSVGLLVSMPVCAASLRNLVRNAG